MTPAALAALHRGVRAAKSAIAISAEPSAAHDERTPDGAIAARRRGGTRSRRVRPLRTLSHILLSLIYRLINCKIPPAMRQSIEKQIFQPTPVLMRNL